MTSFNNSWYNDDMANSLPTNIGKSEWQGYWVSAAILRGGAYIAQSIDGMTAAINRLADAMEKQKGGDE